MKYRKFDIDKGWIGYVYFHEDFDGADDAFDIRRGTGKTIDECKEDIDEYWEQEYSARNEENYIKTC